LTVEGLQLRLLGNTVDRVTMIEPPVGCGLKEIPTPLGSETLTAAIPIGTTEARELGEIRTANVATTPLANTFWLSPTRMHFRVPGVPPTQVNCFPRLVALAIAVAVRPETSACG
jgi:hypothetical protein